MNSKTLKVQRQLKNKLMAAISMLLVSSLMLVTSTYAWFTLSTAPEVTGITTAVGANGNLEMALLPKDGNTATIDTNSTVGNSMGENNIKAETANVSWGNLVDLSDSTIYGLNEITLFPAALNVSGNMLQEALLTIPEYGADGRVSGLSADTLTGVYSVDKFVPDAGDNTQYGVRAVGTASGMTDRQLDYRNARSAANTARVQAASAAASALNSNGSALANIAIKYGMDGTAATFTKEDLAPLRAIIDALKGNDGVFKQIEKGYMQYILAYAASKDQTDESWYAIKGLVGATGATLESVTSKLAENSVTLPEQVAAMITDYNQMVASVNAADTALAELEATAESNAEAEFSWTQISAAMTPLVNPSEMKINDFAVSEVKTNLGSLVSSITSQGGLKVVMGTGAGVFASIADHTEDYSASVNIAKVEYGGITLNDMAARMETKSTKAPNYYLVALGNVVTAAGAPAGAATGDAPITDMYGYVIDLAFRTNAAESNLLLQQDAVDRIYTDNTNDDTMGHGATMTFKATTPDFTDAQVKSLMNAVRIVFFDPGTKNVISYAKLDGTNATFDANGWTSKICLYTISAGSEETYTKATYDENATNDYYQASTQNVDTYTALDDAAAAAASEQLYTANDDGTYTEATYAPGNTYYSKSTTQKTVYNKIENSAAKDVTDGNLYTKTEATAGQEVPKTDNVIMPLTQNSAHRLSVLVYLDGTKITNASVAATAATSMTGSMNLQFSSSATLVPMDYADLHTPGASNGATTE